MKTKQTKIDRSAAKWLPGAMALAATTASSQAATVQITLTGNKISSTGGNQLVADLTGDGGADLVVERAFMFSSFGGATFRMVWSVNGGFVGAGYGGGSFWADAAFSPLGGIGLPSTSDGSPTGATFLNRVSFTDARINGGALTNGYLQVNAFNTSSTNHTMELTRLIFDDASTTRPVFTSYPGAQAEWQVSAVPEPGSNLALLALGAGGLTLRRRLKRAA